MAKRCGSRRRYPVRTERDLTYELHTDFPSGGTIPYEEREVQCQKQFGHPGDHWAMAEDKPLAWPDPY